MTNGRHDGGVSRRSDRKALPSRRTVRVSPGGFPSRRKLRHRSDGGGGSPLLDAASKRRSAPGPNGVYYCILGESAGVLCKRLSALYTACFRGATFPTPWKEANLVLLNKPSRDSTTPRAYRPICLLDVEGKLLERVIASRIDEHLRSGEGGTTSLRISTASGRAVRRPRMRRNPRHTLRWGIVAIAVSNVDIKNAFNSVPWFAIRDGLTSKSVPDYLTSIIGSFLSERKIAYEKPDGTTGRADVFSGVPQGSVLGPLLWDIAYDCVLTRTILPEGKTCYADDTLLVASGRG